MRIPIQRQPRTNTPRTVSDYINVQGATPEAFGAGLGRGLTALGAGLKVAAEDRVDPVERFDALRKLSDHEIELNERVTAVRQSIPESGANYTKTVEEELLKAEEDFIKNLPEKLQPEFRVRYGAIREKRLVEARAVETKTQENFFLNGIDTELNRAKTEVSARPDTFTERLSQIQEAVDTTTLTEAAKAQLKQKIESELAKVKYSTEIKKGYLDRNGVKAADVMDYVVDKVIDVESGGRADLTNPKSTAVGAGQFLEGTWLEAVKDFAPELMTGKSRDEVLALRTDPKLSREILARYLSRNARELEQAGYPPNPTNIYLSHFAGRSGVKRILSADDNTPVSSVLGESAIEANPGVFKNVDTVGQLKEWAARKMGVPVAGTDPEIRATANPDGYWETDNIKYELDGKTRTRPVSKEYVERVSGALSGLGLGAVIVSAAQDKDGPRTGSHRHDTDATGFGHTADFVLTRDGKKILPGDDPELYKRALEELAAQGFTGIGHYNWGIHVGGGSRAVWGPSKTSADVNPEFAAAVRRGWARASGSTRDVIDLDMTYASIPYETRVALRTDAEREAKSDIVQQQKAAAAALEMDKNNLFTGLAFGNFGRAELDSAVERGVLTDYDDRKKAEDILERKEKEQDFAASAVQKYNDPRSLWDHTDADDKKRANMLVGAPGLESIRRLDESYITGGLAPIVSRLQMIPDDVVGVLANMAGSRDSKRVQFALEALTTIETASPQAFKRQMSDDVEKLVARWNVAKGTESTETLLKEMSGGDAPEVRRARESRRKDAEEILRTRERGTSNAQTFVAEFLSENDPGIFTTEPSLPRYGALADALEREYSEAFVQEYEVFGDVALAKESATTRMKLKWGTTMIGGKAQIMPRPPEKYAPKGPDGTHAWLGDHVREVFNLPPETAFELYADRDTEAAIAAKKPPVYKVIYFDDAGFPRVAMTPDGKTGITFTLDKVTAESIDTRFRQFQEEADIDLKIKSKTRELLKASEQNLFDVVKELNTDIEELKAEKARLFDRRANNNLPMNTVGDEFGSWR